MTVFIGLQGTQEELQLSGTNVWAFFQGNDLDGESQRFMDMSIEDVLESNNNVPGPYTQ
jgi:hypothetical protein